MIRQSMITQGREERVEDNLQEKWKIKVEDRYQGSGNFGSCLYLFILLLLVSQLQACMTSQYKGDEICQLCFNPDGSFESCNILNATKYYTETFCRGVCCYRQYSQTVPNSCYVVTPSSSSTPDNTSSETPSVATILVIVFFSIPVVICLIAMIHSCIQHRNRTQAAQPREEAPPTTLNLADYNMDQSFPYHIDTKQQCSICLEEKCNIVTLCGHPYHSQCFGTWIRKKQKCPLCVTRSYNPVTVYCIQCFRAVRMSQIYKRIDTENRCEWLENSRLKCQACQHPAQEGEIEFSINDEDIQKYQEWKKPPVINEICASNIKITPETQHTTSRVVQK